MDAVKRHGTFATHILSAVSDQIKNISANAYVSGSLVVMIISLTAWFITFKVNAEASIRELTADSEALKTELKELKQALPSRDWLELKFSSLEDRLTLKKYGK